MAYQVSRSKPAGAELKRIVLEQTAFAKRCLHTERLSRVEAIHRTRQTIKRSRAAVHLLRPCGKRFYKEVDKALRDLGRLLSAFRDHDVMLQTVEKLRARAEAGADCPELDAAIASLEHWADANRLALAPELAEQVAAFDTGMDELRMKLRTRHMERRRAKAMIREAHRAYSRVKRKLEFSAGSEEAEQLHECRKVVQRALNQCWVMTQYDKRWVQKRMPLLRRLAKDLGYHQDLHVLEQRIGALGGDQALSDGKAELFELIHSEQRLARSRILANTRLL